MGEVVPTSAAVGIDIGGTKTVAGVVDANGTVRGCRWLRTEPERGFEAAVARLIRAVEEVMAEVGLRADQLCGIGIGCAGPVDPRTGRIHNPYTLRGWEDCDVVSPLRERFGVPVCLENDADAAVVGEWWVGAGRGADPVVMLTFGTGVGGGVIHMGRIYRGAEGQHPELGHLQVAEGGPQCYCGRCGCLESLASGTALGTAGSRWGWADARAVLAAADEGHPEAQALVRRAVEAAADAAWTLAHTFLPARLILGGGLMAVLYDQWARAIERRWTGATQFRPSSVKVCRAALGELAGMVGAAALGMGLVAEPGNNASRQHARGPGR